MLRQSTAIVLSLGPIISADGISIATSALTVSAADVKISKNGGVFASKNDATVPSFDSSGYYDVTLNTTDTGSLGELELSIQKSTWLAFFKTYKIISQTSYDAIVSGSPSFAMQADLLTRTANISANQATIISKEDNISATMALQASLITDVAVITAGQTTIISKEDSLSASNANHAIQVDLLSRTASITGSQTTIISKEDSISANQSIIVAKVDNLSATDATQAMLLSRTASITATQANQALQVDMLSRTANISGTETIIIAKVDSISANQAIIISKEDSISATQVNQALQSSLITDVAVITAGQTTIIGKEDNISATMALQSTLLVGVAVITGAQGNAVVLSASQPYYRPAISGDKMDIVDTPNSVAIDALADNIWKTLLSFKDTNGSITQEKAWVMLQAIFSVLKDKMTTL